MQSTRRAHPNRLPFRGVLTRVDEPSDGSPAGARGHKVLLTRDAVSRAIAGLIGMAVDVKAGFDGHDNRAKVGIITAAELQGREVAVQGFVYARDFPEVETVLEQDETRTAYGMSFEMADVDIVNMRAEIWTVEALTFTGAAILRRDKAAFRQTSFRLEHGGRPFGPAVDVHAWGRIAMQGVAE